MSEEVKTQDPVVNTATPNTTSDTSPVDESGKDESRQEVSHEAEGTQETVTPEQYKELERKYSESSKEARILKEEKDLVQDKWLKTITKDRSTFESYLDSEGITPEVKSEYLTWYDSQVMPGIDKGQPKATEPAPNVQPMTAPVNPVRNSWMSRLDQEEQGKIEEQKRASTEFLDMPENRDLDQETLKAIWTQAAYFDRKHGMSPREALNAARKVLVDVDSIKDEGYVQGIRDGMGGGVSGGISGSSSSKGSAFQLSKKDNAFVDAHIQNQGLNSEQADSFRREYALRVQRKSE